MERIHQALLEGGRLATVQKPQPISGISPDMSPATYVRFGIRPELAQITHSTLHQMAERAATADKPVNAAFAGLVQQLNALGRPRKRSVPFIHFLGIAAHYGITFATVSDLRESVDVVHQMTAPGIQNVDKRLQRQHYWDTFGDLLALLGEGVAASPVTRELQAGLSATVITNAVQILIEQEAPISGSRLLWLSILCEREDLDASSLGQLVNTLPQRTDDLIELMRRSLVNKKALVTLLEEPDLVSALSLDALDELLTIWSPSEGPLLDTARMLSTELIETNTQAQTGEGGNTFEEEEEDEQGDEEEDEGSEPDHPDEEPSLPNFDHTRLDLGEAAGKRTGKALEAVQILLVHGVIQPGREHSSMINGSEVPREELDELCKPHLREAGVSNRAFEQAINFLTTTFVLATHTTGGRKRGSKKHRSRRVRFVAQANRHTTGHEIAKRVLALNREVRG